MHSNPLVLIHVFRTLHGICYSFTRTHEPQSKPPTELASPLLICAMNLLTFLWTTREPPGLDIEIGKTGSRLAENGKE